MKMGDSSSETTPRPIPSPWAGAVVGALTALPFMAFFGPVFTVVGMIVGGLLGGICDHYSGRLETWNGSKPHDPKNPGLGFKVITAVGVGAGGLALLALPIIAIFDL